MKVVVLYRSQTEYERAVLEFERDYRMQTGRDLALVDLDTKEGADLAELYDIVRYPAVLARSNNGELLQLWQGEILPLIRDVTFYDQPE
jgi:hypothetical protein